ncbi:hypothetical protein [Halomicronema sp. CCY15110]|uniref:hypothetical protein n=1 Tax=Halomicronema sp. CCY15110 TaxID=2767773 RepID=UPI00194E4AEB|nr:hypothetical protein [Halomicronema sp. CCY15110]
MSVFKIAATTIVTGCISLGVMSTAQAQYETFEISPGFTPDPLVGSGVSGGPDEVDGCGFIDTADSPDHVLYVNDYFDYLRVSVESPGDVTLFMENIETGEAMCVDDSNGTLLPEFAGEWPAGTYFLWIGDFDGGAYPYDIYISEF